MTTFSYSARNKDHIVQKGTMVAKDRSAVLETLKNRGLLPLLVKEAGGKKKLEIKLPFVKKKVKAKDLVVFTRELSTMINAGVPIVRSLNTLKEQAESPELQRVLEAVTGKVQGGAPLSDSLEAHPKVFSLVYVNMVRAGEAGGILDKILERLANQVEKDAEIKSKVKGALIYPGVIVTITIFAFVFLMTGIVPKLAAIFDQYEAELPLQTKIMLGISSFMQVYWWLLLIILAGLVFAIIRIHRTPKGKYKIDSWLLKMPVFGKVLMKTNVARFARTFSSLTGAGVSVLDGLSVTSKSLGNAVIRKGIEEATAKVKNGQPISESIEESHIFPPIISQMTAVGEETGQVDKVLDKMADFYEKEVDRVISSITSIIEPLLIVTLGTIVGLIVASVFGPISSLTEVVK